LHLVGILFAHIKVFNVEAGGIYVLVVITVLSGFYPLTAVTK